jgi:hypothetical protein
MPNYNALAAQLDELVRKIDRTLDDDLAKRKQTFHLEHDDGNGDGDGVDDTWSEHADAVAAGNNTDYEDGDGYDDEEVEDDFDKYSREETGGYQQSNESSNRPGQLPESSHTSSSNARHKFMALVADIKQTHGIPATTAMAYARQQDPTGYAAFQGRNGVSKAAPSTFEGLVQEQMMKGCTREVAAQRVANLHGYPVLRNRSLSKGEATSVLAENQLLQKAESIFQEGGDRCEALRRARKASPRLYRALTR